MPGVDGGDRHADSVSELSGPSDDILALIEELMDAHVDAIQLLCDRCDSVESTAHVDYVKRLQRAAHAAIAGWTPQPDRREREQRRAAGE